MTGTKLGASALISTLFLSACADTPQATDAPDTTAAEPAAASTADTVDAQPAVAAAAPSDGQSKLVLYRTSFGGFALQPSIFVDGRNVANCVPGRATTLNVAPGTYRVTAKTLSEKELTVTVPEGGTAYVKCSISVGLVVGGAKLVSVPATEAAPKVAKLKQATAN